MKAAGEKTMSDFNAENNEIITTQTETPQDKQKRTKSPWIVLTVFAVLVAVSFVFTIVAGSLLIANMSVPDDSSNGSSNTENSNPLIDITDPALYGFIPTTPTFIRKPVNLLPETPDVSMEYTDIYIKLCPSIVRILTSSSSFGNTSYSATGFFITSDGYIFTNAHVVEGVKQVEVLTYDNKLYKAEIIGYDSLNDVALIKVKGNNFTPVEFRDSDSLLVGEELSIIGGPRSIELSYTMTHGILSGIRYDISFGADGVRDLLQTDTPTNKGNSGSPLIDKNGKVVGMISSKLYTTSDVTIEGLAFAVPINVASDMIDELLLYGRKLQSPAIGIINSVYIKANGSTPGGMVIGGTIRGSDAEAKGIKAGDIITRFNGTEITSTDVLVNEIAKLKPYETVTVEIYSEGNCKTVAVKLGEFIEY